MAIVQRPGIVTHFKKASTLYFEGNEGRLVELSAVTGHPISRIVLGCSGPIQVPEKPIGTFLPPRFN